MQLASVTLEAFVEGGGPFSSVCGFQSKQKKGEKTDMEDSRRRRSIKKQQRRERKKEKSAYFYLVARRKYKNRTR